MVVNELLLTAETAWGIVPVRIIAEERGVPTIFELDEWEAFEHGEARVQLMRAASTNTRFREITCSLPRQP